MCFVLVVCVLSPAFSSSFPFSSSTLHVFCVGQVETSVHPLLKPEAQKSYVNHVLKNTASH